MDASSSASDQSANGPARPRNLLLIVSDDQGLVVGCYGDPDARTPHIDRLANEGCRFTRAYTPVAVCTPSRAVIFTGRMPHRSGAMGFQPIDDAVPIWPDLLREAGVRTGLIGKLNVKPPKRFEFDYERLAGPHDDDAWRVEWYVDGLKEFLDASSDPFAMVVSLRDPHRPFPRDGAPTGWPGDDATPRDPESMHVPPRLVDDPLVRGDLAHFHDAIRRLDVTVGAVLALLEERGLARDTLVVFTSDNGEPFPYSKTTLYERGIHMPLVARWPGVVEPGSVEDAFVSFTDFLPTALAIAGAPDSVSAEMDGRSLLPLLRGDAGASGHDVIVGSHTDHLHEPAVPARSIRVGDWKYIRNLRPRNRFVNDDMLRSATWQAMEIHARTQPAVAEVVQRLQYRPQEELYDLGRDPYELDNLAEREPERVRELRARLDAILAAQADPLLEEFRAP